MKRAGPRELALRQQREVAASGTAVEPEQLVVPGRLIRITQLVPSPWADLFDHPEAHILALAEDIEERGIQTPLQVYPLPNQTFELLTGHDRLAAAKLLELTDVPCEVRSMLTDEDARFRHFISDNTQRKDVDKRVLAAAVLKRAGGNISNLQVGKLVRCDLDIVESVRCELVADCGIPNLAFAVGTDGRRYPLKKPRKSKPQEPSANGEPEVGETEAKKPDARTLSGKLNGETPESVARRGIEYERAQGPNAANAANEVGLARRSYSELKKIILLCDDPHLQSRDATRVRAALDAVNGGGSVDAAYESVRDVSEAKFGIVRGNGTERAAVARLAALERAILALATTCAALDVIKVPAGIPAVKRKEWLADLGRATASLRSFYTRVKEA